MERKLCDNLGDDEKEQVRKDDKKRKMDKRSQTLDKGTVFLIMLIT